MPFLPLNHFGFDGRACYKATLYFVALYNFRDIVFSLSECTHDGHARRT